MTREVTLVTMILNFKVEDIYRNYQETSLEELEKQRYHVELHLKYVQYRKEHHSCSCELHAGETKVNYKMNGDILAEFPTLRNSLFPCQACSKTFEPFRKDWIGAGYSIYDHHHPILLLIGLEHRLNILNLAIHCKDKQYHLLSDEDLQKEVTENETYRRYLRRCEDNFEEEVPSGLGDEIHKAEEDADALHFEQHVRGMRNPTNDHLYN